MNIRGKKVSFAQVICLVLYYCFAKHLPQSTTPFLGKICKFTRYILCKKIFRFCGKNVNIEHGANFGWGINVEIGNNSGIGVNACVPYTIKIGDNVMMGPECYILAQNHDFVRTDIPMNQQGYKSGNGKRTIIGNDVWIGRQVTMTPNRIIQDGTIIGACCLLCKDFPAYSIVGGNPSKLIRSRLDNKVKE